MYILHLDDFEGPLDLLLYLIKKNKMNIFDIKLEVIIDQYIDYINSLQEIDLDVSSSYLVLASDLMLIKSKKLLPNEEEIIPEEVNLIEALTLYEQYKNQLDVFKNLSIDRNKKLSKEKNVVEYSFLLQKDDYNRLFDVLQKFLEEQKDVSLYEKNKKIQGISVKEREKFIYNKMLKLNRAKFLDLFEEKGKDYIIASFLAILNLCKNKKMIIDQNDVYSDIYCEVRHG